MMIRAVSRYQKIIPRLGNFLVHQRQFNSAEEGKTVTRVLNQEAGSGLMVNGFSVNGFVLNNGMTVVGPIALFPKSVLSWRVQSPQDISEDSLSLFHLLDPKLDILLIGIGDKGNALNPRILQYLRNKGIGFEVLPTEAACTTFNFLNDEGRYVAAALIPPSFLRTNEDDLIRSQARRNKLFQGTIDEL